MKVSATTYLPGMSRSRFAIVLALVVFLAACGGKKPVEQPASTSSSNGTAVTACLEIGSWRDTRPNWENTTTLCEAPHGREVRIAFDSGSTWASPLDETGKASTGDVFTVNPDGSLTISDDDGPIITLE